MAERGILVHIVSSAVRLMVGVGVGACCASVPLFDVKPAGVKIVPVVIPFLGVGRRVTAVGSVRSVYVWSWWWDIACIGQKRCSDWVCE